MTFETFVKNVTEDIKNYLPEEFADAEVKVFPYEKLNESYTGMIVIQPGKKTSPIISLDFHYEKLPENVCSKEADEYKNEVKNIASLIVEHSNYPEVDANFLLDYERVKDKLFIRVSSAIRNKDLLKKVPHFLMEDLAITYHIFVRKSEDGISSSPVTYKMLKGYGVTEEQLKEDALINAPKNFPSSLLTMASVLREQYAQAISVERNISMEEANKIAETFINNTPAEGKALFDSQFIVTNTQQLNGASVLFYPGVLEQLGEKLGSFYALPSSVHEFILYAFPEKTDENSISLSEMVRKINATNVVENNDILSDHAYFYNAETKTFSSAK